MDTSLLVSIVFANLLIYGGFCFGRTNTASLKDDSTVSKINNENIEAIRATPKQSSSRRKWITQIFLEAETIFDIHPNVTAKCKNDYELYKLFLQNQTLWAVRMLESSEWPSVGVFAGMMHHLGNWDECLRVEQNDFRGQYCLPAAKFEFDYVEPNIENPEDWVFWPNENLSVWRILQKYREDPIRIDRQRVFWALCIPSSCTIEDVHKSVYSTISPVFNKYKLNVSVELTSAFCKVEENMPLSAGFYIVGFLFMSGVVTIICATTYDLLSKKREKRGEFAKLFCFYSLRENYKKLNTFSPETSFPIVHFIKIFTAFFVLTGHRIMLYYFFPLFNAEKHEMFTKTLNFELLQTNIVDIFLMISGYLTYLHTLTPIRKGGIVYAFFYIIFRWLRMVTVPGLLILLFIFIGPYTKDGPFWDYYFTKMVGYCERNWWATLLAVNNIVRPDEQCLPHTWYISVDIQLSILATLLLYIMSKNKAVGNALTIFIFVAAHLFMFVFIYWRRYYGLTKMTITNLRMFNHMPDYNILYVATYSRIGPYFVGLLAAMLAKKLNSINYTFSSVSTILILVSTFVVGKGFTMYGFVFYQSNRPYNPLENAIYGAFNRSLFALPYACLLCIYFTSGLGVFTKLFERKIFVAIGRLVFCVYLIGPIIQAYQILSQRSYIAVSDKIFAYWLASSDLLVCFLIGFLAHLAMEAPINNMLKWLQLQLFNLVNDSERFISFKHTSPDLYQPTIT